MAVISRLPESPRYFLSQEKEDDAHRALKQVYPHGEDAKKKLDGLIEDSKQEGDEKVTYKDMFTPSHAQFHPTMITIMGQVNQALTGYGAVSVYGPQIFEVSSIMSSIQESMTTLTSFGSSLVLAFDKQNTSLKAITSLTSSS